MNLLEQYLAVGADLDASAADHAEQLAAARRAFLAALEPAQLVELDGALLTRFEQLDGEPPTPEVLGAQVAIVDSREMLRTENDERIAAQTQAETERAELRARMAGTDPQPPAEQRPGQGDPPVETTPPAPEQTPVEQTPAPEAVAASARPAAPAARRAPAALGAMSGHQPAATARPRPDAPDPHRASLRVADGQDGAGRDIDWNALGARTLERMRISEELGGGPGRMTLATIDWSDAFPAERRLAKGDSTANTQRIDSLTSRDAMVAAAAAFLATSPSDFDAMTAAAGGFCQPFPIDYTVPVQGSIARPLRDTAFARFGADRGGVTFVTPPERMSGPAAAGVGTWTATDDAAVTLDPTSGAYTSAKTKPIADYQCLPDTTEVVAAITHRQSFSNFTARFNPEQVGAFQAQGLVEQAAFAEVALLQGLWNRVQWRVTTSQTVGAARDFFRTLDTVAWQARGRDRVDLRYPLRLAAPFYLVDMIRADIVMQMPAGDLNQQMAVADATILAWLRARNINATWLLDDRTGTNLSRTQASLATNADLTSAPVLAAAALNDFPDTIEWYLYVEGTFQFLDGGSLDLGVVRDTRTNSVNRFETFAETFEGLAKRGRGGYAIRSPFDPTGAAAGLVATQGIDY